MTCNNVKERSVHSSLCDIHYPYSRIAPSSNVKATKQRDCTLRSTVPADSQNLGFEANMDLVSLDEFQRLILPTAKFGTYCMLKKSDKGAHFCVDRGRRTVDGRRLSWLWIFPRGDVRSVHKTMDDKPSFVWTKQQIIDAYLAADNPTLPMWTRHVDTYSELAITFCLPFA